MMEKVWGIIYGRPPPFTYQDSVIPMEKEILAEYNPTRLIFCASCKNILRQYRDMCGNPECTLYESHLKRTKGVQRSEVYLINMIPQLSDILENEVREIIDFHLKLHRNRGGPALNRSDVRYFESFYQGIEKVDDFDRNRLRILLSLSIDGFIPKRLTRREVWPIYLGVDNLGKAVADNYYNSILCGVYFSFSKPSSEMLETLFSRLESEIRSLRIEPLMIEVDGVTWVLNVEIQRGIADMGAQRALFGLPHWESPQGCSKCYIPGERINNHRVWICREGNDKRLRNSQSFVEDGENRTNGVPGVTPVMRIVTPSQFMSDALHVCSEGVTKDRLRDMISATSKFASLKLNKEAVDSMKKCLMHITSHKYSRAIIHSLEVVNMAKAKEIDELAFIVFPLSASSGIIASPIAAISLLGYWLCIRIVHDCRSLTTAKIGVAQNLAALTKRLWIAIAPEVFTMKTHWSSAPFERHHSRLQVGVHQYTRNNPAAIIERYLVSKKLRVIFGKRFSSSKKSEILDLKIKLENKHLNRLPVGIHISDCMYIPANCWIRPAHLQEAHKEFLQWGEEAYSRVVINGKPYSSRDYWRRSLHSRQDMVHIKSDSYEAFGDLVMKKPTATRPKLAAAPRHSPTRTLSGLSKANLSLVRAPSSPPPSAYGFPHVYHELQPLTVEKTDERNELLIVEKEDEICRPLVESPPQPARKPRTLYDCIHGVTLDVHSAASLILNAKRSRTFNKAVYEEFVKSEAAFRVQRFDHDFFLNSGTADDSTLSSIAHFLMSEIQIAKYDRLARAFESQSRKAKDTNGQSRFMSLNNLTRTWKIDEAPPFKSVEISELLVRFSFHDTEPCYQNFARVFRFIFQQLTEPPQRIQDYAIRYYRKAGRERHLRNLPATVEVTLMDFALDLIGLGDPQLRLGKRAASEITRFYIELGESENDRQNKLDELLAEFDLFKAEILKGLQLALRDVRSYKYDIEEKQWLSHAKRRRKAPENDRVMELREVQNQAYRA